MGRGDGGALLLCSWSETGVGVGMDGIVQEEEGDVGQDRRLGG